MAASDEMHLVSTGHRDIDGYLTIVFYLFTGVLLIHVAYIFWSAYRDNVSSRRSTRSRRTLRKDHICLFLLLASVAFVVVNRPKFQGQTTNLAKHAVFEDVKAAVDDVANPKSYPQRIIKNEVDYKKIKSSMEIEAQRMAKLRLKGDSYPKKLVEKARQQARAMFAFAHDWNRSDNVWDNFKILVATRSRQWWTQQWFGGYIAWTFFVAVECRQRSIGNFGINAFILLGYIFGLAGVQSLFYILLLMKPKTRTTASMPHPFGTVAWLAVALSLVAGLPEVLLESFVKSKPGEIHGAQAFVILLPVLAQCFFMDCYQYVEKPPKSARKLQKVLSIAWFALSIAAAAGNVYASWEAYKEVGTAFWGSWSIFGRDTKTIAKDTGSSFVDALNEHVWLRSLGYDVLLSILGVFLWFIICNAETRSVIKCSLYPWVDETEAAVVHARDKTEDAFYSVKASAKKAGQDLRRRASHLQAAIGLSDDEDVEWEEDGRSTAYDRRGRSVSSYTPHESAANGRPVRSVSASTARSRSRSRASVSPVKRAAVRQSSRPRNLSLSRRESGVFDDEDDKLFGSNVDAFSGQAEAVGLILILFGLGGLGMASSAVFGANMVN